MPGNTQYDRVKEITDQLEAGLNALFESEAYRTYLTTLSRFHDYSLNNTILIAMQKPDATLVAGYTTWKKQFGRQVNRGEKAIRILAPSPYKQKIEVDKRNPVTGEKLFNPDGSAQKEVQEILRPAFKVVNVFDISQTDGPELPSIGVDELTGEVQQFDLFFEALKRSCPVPVGFENIPSGAKGYYHQAERRIAVQEGMSQIQIIKTTIHEMAHQKLHAIDPETGKPDAVQNHLTRNGKEVEAESVAYTVCQHYGIDTSEYSFAYIAGWSHGKETPELKASLNTIRKAASELISDIDSHMKELQHESEKDCPVHSTSEQEKKEAAYRIGKSYLEIHEAADESWDFTIYDEIYRESDGGQISNSETMSIGQAVKEVLNCYQLDESIAEEMDRKRLETLTGLYDPNRSESQIRFMGEVVEKGFDPHEFWSGGQMMDLTRQNIGEDRIEELRYQLKVDAIPRMLFTEEQWKAIQEGIDEKADVTVYADPKFTPEQMRFLHGALNAEYFGYVTKDDVMKIADPSKPPEQMEKELKELRKMDVCSKQSSERKKSGSRKSVLADLRTKQAQISGEGRNPKLSQRKSKEMDGC